MLECSSQGQTNYNYLIAYICPAAAIDSLTIEVEWNSVESDTLPDADAGTGNYDFATLDMSLASLKTACNAMRTSLSPIRINIVFAPATEGGQNTSTPAYVLEAPWAAMVGFPHANDMAVCGSYDGGTSSPYKTAACPTG